jgi:peptidoglycan/LPS O-acetylase OafA/YrhL
MRERIPGLDLLRAGAISLVLFVHGANFFSEPLHLAFSQINTGPIGVDVFFVLSGFLIGGILLQLGDRMRDSRVAAGFWVNRAIRTLPNYYLFLALNAAAWILVFRHHSDFDPWPSFVRSLFFSQTIFHRPTEFFPESWSLCVEEWFYLLFPIGLLLGLKLRIPFLRLYLVLTGLLMAVSFLLRLSLKGPVVWNLDVNSVLVYKFDAIGMGLAAVAVSRMAPNRWLALKWILLPAGLALIFEAYGFIARASPSTQDFRRIFLPLITPLGAACLLPWASQCRSLGGGVFERAVAAVARWSYSLYLSNRLIEWFVDTCLGPALGYRLALVAYLGLSLAASAALYHWFELPVLRVRSRITICRESLAGRREGAR